MIGQRRQAVRGPEARRAEVDPELARHLAVDAAGSTVCARRSRLDFRRHALDLEVARHQRREGARQPRADVSHPVLEQRHDARAARVVIGKLEARILAERRHALAHSALGQALPLEDRVHLGLERGQFLTATVMDLVRRHPRRRRRAQGPGVVGIALRELPYASVGLGALPMRFQLGNLAVKRRGNRIRRDLCGLGAVVARQVFRTLRHRGDDCPVGDVAATRDTCLGKSLVEYEIRRDHALRCRRLESPRLAIDLAGIGLKSFEVGFGIFSRLQRVLLVEQARDLEEGAGVLRDNVGRVPPRPVLVEKRHVAVREVESLRRGLMRRAHDIKVDACRFVQVGGVYRAQSLEPGCNAAGNRGLTCGRAVGQARLQGRARSGIDAEAGCVLGIIGEQFFRDSGEQLLNRRVGSTRSASADVGKRRDECGRSGDEIPASGSHWTIFLYRGGG